MRSRQDAYFEALYSWSVFETENCWNLEQNGKRQSLNLENDKLKDKIQEIFAELRNLLDEMDAKPMHLNGYRWEEYHGNSEQYQEDFTKYV